MTKWLIKMQLRAFMKQVWNSFVDSKRAHERFIMQLFLVRGMTFASRIR